MHSVDLILQEISPVLYQLVFPLPKSDRLLRTNFQHFLTFSQQSKRGTALYRCFLPKSTDIIVWA